MSTLSYVEYFSIGKSINGVYTQLKGTLWGARYNKINMETLFFLQLLS